MGKTTAISWTDATFNPWIGCTKVSAGCANCYAERDDSRRKWTPDGWGKGKPRKRTSASNWRNPIKWNAEAAKEGKRLKVFCASLADIFDLEVPDEWRDDLFNLIGACRHLDWLLLTKRPEKAKEYLTTRRVFATLSGGWPWSNCWLGVSVEDQKTADERIPILLETPAALRWVSYEPALGPVDFTRLLEDDEAELDALVGLRYSTSQAFAIPPRSISKLDWIIVGGESGANARPFDLEWAHKTIVQCRDARSACFVKQMGSRPIVNGEPTFPNVAVSFSDWKGADPSEWPKYLRVQEFPR